MRAPTYFSHTLCRRPEIVREEERRRQGAIQPPASQPQAGSQQPERHIVVLSALFSVPQHTVRFISSLSTMAPPSNNNTNTNKRKSTQGGGGGGGALGSSANNGMKQGTLFSFFSRSSASSSGGKSSAKKQQQAAQRGAVDKDDDGAARSAAATAAAAATSEAGEKSAVPKEKKARFEVGARVDVYFPMDDEYYAASVTATRDSDGFAHLKYDCDGATEWIDLARHRYRRLREGGDDGEETKQQRPSEESSSSAAAAAANKRRRIQEDGDDNDDESDEEMEFDGDEDDDESESSAYEDDDQDGGDDEDDDGWMVSDEDDDEIVQTQKKTNGNKKKNAKTSAAAAKVIEYKPTTKTSDGDRRQLSSSYSSFSPMTADMSSFSFQPTPKHVTPAVSNGTALTSSSSDGTTPSLLPRGGSGDASISPASGAAAAAAIAASAPPMYEKGAANPGGSHVHNHLSFLRNPRDAKGRSPDHPDYDCRTLQVRHSEWENHCSKMTAAVQQWWDLKAQYYDTVLLFKTGKFYEMFHMDADVGVRVCGLSYMKGHVAHAGFPEKALGANADKLVRAGYKVARVEQTETPDMLKERKQKQKSGNKPKAVNREVCSVMTIGTRTFCYLDDSQGLLNDDATSSSSQVGPLLSIREVPIESNQRKEGGSQGGGGGDDDDDVHAVCEYGITLVDAIRGSVTIGQFADDMLRSRMDTLLTTFRPCEVSLPEQFLSLCCIHVSPPRLSLFFVQILIQGGADGASPALHSMIRSLKASCHHTLRVEVIRSEESFPKSTAIDPAVRRQLERPSNAVHPWDVTETLHEIHRRRYYPQASKKQDNALSVSRWPAILRAAVEGEAQLAISSFGAALFYLQRNLIDRELLSMGIVKAYTPPVLSVGSEKEPRGTLHELAVKQTQAEDGVGDEEQNHEENEQQRRDELRQHNAPPTGAAPSVEFSQGRGSMGDEDFVTHMSLDGTTLRNLEILANSVDNKTVGSLWAQINHTRTPHGSRLLRAWLLRPLFRKDEIDRRADAVEELVSGAAAAAMSEAAKVLSKCGDIERYLSRVHSMGLFSSGHDENGFSAHPNERAIMYEEAHYTKRKVGDFSKVLNGLRDVTQIPEIFQGIELRSPLLQKLFRTVDQGGRFPNMIEQLDYFFDNIDLDRASKGQFEPSRGIDEEYDAACEAIDQIESELKCYKEDMCANALTPRNHAKSTWKYVNVKPDSKDKYLIELPASITVPDDFIMKGKRGSGPKQVNKYRTPFVERLVVQLEQALDVQRERKARGLQLIFAKFDSYSNIWAAASTATAMIDALQSIAKASSMPGYTRPEILDCPPGKPSSIKVVQGRHPCVEKTLISGEFVPNDLTLGLGSDGLPGPRVLLLSGVNMGGKSTCLRQTCLISILAQMGCFVPADECSLTPVDRIFTRLGASDRILLGQSTFFVEVRKCVLYMIWHTQNVSFAQLTYLSSVAARMKSWQRQRRLSGAQLVEVLSLWMSSGGERRPLTVQPSQGMFAIYSNYTVQYLARRA